MKIMTKSQNGLIVALIISASWLYPTTVAAEIGMTYEEGMQQQRDHAQRQNEEAYQRGGPLSHGSYHEEQKEIAKMKQREAERISNEEKRRNLEKIFSFDRYTAVAWHPDANDFWAVWNNPISNDNAMLRVLEACNKAMKKGCSLVAAGKNITVSLATVDGVVTEAAWDENADHALMGVMNKCHAKWGEAHCKAHVQFGSFKSHNTDIDTSSTYFPTAENVIRLNKRVKRASDPASKYFKP